PYVMVYIDDIIIFSKTENQHFKHIQEVFKILNKNKLHIKLEKCHLFKKELKYLGHIINAEGVRPDPKYIEKTLKLVKPKNLQGLQRLLGVIQWVAKYIPRIQEIVQPLNKLKSKNKKFEWNQKHDKILDKVKAMVKKLPVLMYPDINKPFVMETDASEYGMGAVLLQEDENGILKPVEFFSKLFTQHQRNWSAGEKECYAIVCALEKWRKLVIGTEVLIFSDARNLASAHKLKDLSSKITRLFIRLAPFNF